MTQSQLSYETDTQQILAILRDYFDGLYEADIPKLRSIFHPDANLQSIDYRMTRDEWLELVADRPIPKKGGMAYEFKLLSLEIVGQQAMVKAEAPLLAGDYVDFIGLLKENGEWKVANKMFVAV